MGHLKRAVHLVGRDVVEALPFVFLRERFPIELSCLKERQGAHYVGAREGERVFDTPVHVALGGKMDDAVHLFLLHKGVEAFEVADVHLDELVVRLVLYVLEVFQVAGVGQFVKVDDLVLGIFVDKQADNVTADESGTSGYDDGSAVVHNWLEI